MGSSLRHCEEICYLGCWQTVWAPVQVPDVPLMIQLNVNVSGRAVEDFPSVWAPALMYATQKEFFWLLALPWTALAGAAIWRVNQQM